LGHLKRKYRRENYDRGRCGRIGSQSGDVHLEHEVVRALPGYTPERLPKELGPLAPMKLVQEVIEITGRRLLMSLQTQKLSDLFVVEMVHAAVD
jgi:hypothetical protein